MGSKTSCCHRRVREDDVHPYTADADETEDVNSSQISLTFDEHVEALNNAAEEELEREMRRRAEIGHPTNMNANNDIGDDASMPSECSTIVYRHPSE